MLRASFEFADDAEPALSSDLPVTGSDGVTVMIPSNCIPYEGPDGRVVAIPPNCTIAVGSNGRATAVCQNAIAVADASGLIRLYPKTFSIASPAS